MSVQKNEIYDLLKRLEIILEKSFPILPNYLVAIKLKEVEAIIDSIYGSLPQEVQEARRLLRRKEELQMEAQQKAEKIILDAQNEAARLLSESELLRKIDHEKKNSNFYIDTYYADCRGGIFNHDRRDLP